MVPWNVVAETPSMASPTTTAGVDSSAPAMAGARPLRRETGLCALVYLSTAVKVPTTGQLTHLLARARQRNALEGVTGVLLYAEGSFVQYLEGPTLSVNRVYQRILKDPLHQGIFEVFRESIAEREFFEWDMAFAPTKASGLSAHFPMSSALVNRICASERSLSGARHLLHACWDDRAGVYSGKR